MPDFAKLHDAWNKKQEQLKTEKKKPVTTPHEFALSSTNRKVVPDINASVPSMKPTSQNPSQRQTLMSLPSLPSTPLSDRHHQVDAPAPRSSTTPGMTQLMPLRLPYAQPAQQQCQPQHQHQHQHQPARDSSPSESFSSFMPPAPASFLQPTVVPSTTSSYSMPWSQYLLAPQYAMYAPQFIPPPATDSYAPAAASSASPARPQYNSTPKRTPSSFQQHAHHHHVTFAAEAPELHQHAAPAASPMRPSALPQQSPSGFDVPLTELTVDLEEGGEVHARNIPHQHVIESLAPTSRATSALFQQAATPQPKSTPLQLQQQQHFQYHQAVSTHSFACVLVRFCVPACALADVRVKM